MKRTNPNKQMISLFDARKMIHNAGDVTLQNTLALMFHVLHDKHGFSVKDLQQLYLEVDSLSTAIKNGYCTIADIRTVLKEESGIRFGDIYNKKILG